MKIEYFKTSETPDFSLRSYQKDLNQFCPCALCEHKDTYEGDDGVCELCYLDDQDGSSPEHDAFERVYEFFNVPYLVCFCNDQDGLSDPKTGHREKCFLGERGRKVRRRLEDRLRKDPLCMLWIAEKLSIAMD